MTSSLNHNLADFLPWSRETDTDGKSILLLDNASMCGDFMFTTLMIKAAKQDVNMKILSFNHGKSHYESLFRKNGIDIDTMEKSGRLHMHEINISKQYSNPSIQIIEDNTTGNIPIISLSIPGNDHFTVNKSDNSTWDSLLELLTSESFYTTDIPIVLLIDDLKTLEILAPNETASRCLISLLYDNLYKKKISSLIMFSNETEIENESSVTQSSYNHSTSAQQHNISPALAEICKYRSDIVAVSKPLASGYTGYVHGNISVTHGLHRDNYVFHAADSGVKCSKLGN
eukprot:gene13677-29080_t